MKELSPYIVAEQIIVVNIQVVVETATRGVLWKSILKSFAILIGKHLHWSLYLIKLQAFGLKNTFLEEHLWMVASVVDFIFDQSTIYL